ATLSSASPLSAWRNSSCWACLVAFEADSWQPGSAMHNAAAKKQRLATDENFKSTSTRLGFTHHDLVVRPGCESQSVDAATERNYLASPCWARRLETGRAQGAFN